MKTMNQRVHDFWFEAAPATRLALLRILICGFATVYLISEYPDYLKVARTDPRLFDPVGVVFGNTPIGLELFRWLLSGTIVAGVLFTVGLWHRISGPVFAVLALWLFCYRNSWSMIYHSDNLVALHAIVLGFTRCADALSLDALFRARKKDGDGARESISWMYGWPVKLICAVTVCTYFVTAVAKLMGPLGLEWMTGPALRSQMAVDGIRKELLGGAPNALSYAIYEWLPLFTVLAIGSLLTELLAPLALFNRRLGRLWAINAFLMHLGILEMMRITFHYQLWGVMFASFFPLERLVEWPRKLWRRPAPNEPRESTKRQQSAKPPPLPEPSPGLATAPSAARATIYYDGECGLCDRFVQFVLRHDHREHFQFATLQSDAGRAQLRQLGLPETELKTVVLGEEGKLYERSTATLRVCRRLGGLWPLCFTFIVIPKRWRDGVYTLLTRNRRRGFKDTPACEVIPPHWRRRFIN